MWTEEHGLHGMRLSPSRDAAGDWFKGPGMDPIFARAQDLGIPMLILTGASRMPDLARIPRPLPRRGLLHRPHGRRPSRQPGGAAIADGYGALSPRACQDQPHLVDFPAGLSVGPIRTGWSRKCTRPLGRSALCGARIGRCALSKARYDQALTVVRDEMKFIAPEDLEWVLGKTVLKLWPFGEA